MNIPIFGFLLNAATRWTPRTFQSIAAKLRYPRSNILLRIFQVFLKKKTLIRVEHKIFPNSRGLVEFFRLHLTPRNVKYINRVVARYSPKFCCTVKSMKKRYDSNLKLKKIKQGFWRKILINSSPYTLSLSLAFNSYFRVLFFKKKNGLFDSC